MLKQAARKPKADEHRSSKKSKPNVKQQQQQQQQQLGHRSYQWIDPGVPAVSAPEEHVTDHHQLEIMDVDGVTSMIISVGDCIFLNSPEYETHHYNDNDNDDDDEMVTATAVSSLYSPFQTTRLRAQHQLAFVALVERMWQDDSGHKKNKKLPREDRMKLRARWFFKKQDLQSLGGKMRIIGPQMSRLQQLIETMDNSNNDLILSDHSDDNSVITILGKCTVLRRSPHEPITEHLPLGTFVCRYSIRLGETRRTLLTAVLTPFLRKNDVWPALEETVEKELHVPDVNCSVEDAILPVEKKVATTFRAFGSDNDIAVRDDSVSDSDEVSGHNLLAINGLSKESVKRSVAKVLPKDLAPFAFNVGLFFVFAYERQRIWEKRNNGDPAPFTKNFIMENYFFCNVSQYCTLNFLPTRHAPQIRALTPNKLAGYQNYRELDRGTAYFHGHAVNLFEKYSRNGVIDEKLWLEKILWGSICYRLVNKVETFLQFGGIPELEQWPTFKHFFLNDEKIKCKFTGAHQTMGERRYIETMSTLDEASLKDYANDMFQRSKARKLKDCCKILETIPNVGRFLAWQITCDLLESKCLAPCSENDYATLGKGADIGVAIIFADGMDRTMNGLHFAHLLREKCDDVYNAMGLVFPKFHGMPITLKHIEHALCEFQKFISLSKQYEHGVHPVGQRTIKQLRSHLDCEKSCHYVSKCGNSEDVIFCDFCLVAYCSECVVHPADGKSWMCHRCHKLTIMAFTNEHL